MRSFQLEIYVKALDVQEAIDKAKDIGHIVVDIVRAQKDTNWGGRVIDSAIVGPNEEDPVIFDKYKIGVVTLVLSFLSYENIPDKRIDAGLIENDESSSGLSKLIEEVITQHHDTPLFDLSLAEVAQVDRAFHPAIPKYPAITIATPDYEIDRRYAGVDVTIRHYEITVWTKLLDKEVKLDQNLDVVEKLKDLLNIYQGWNGKCMRSILRSVEFGINELPIGKVYRSTIFYDCELFIPI